MRLYTAALVGLAVAGTVLVLVTEVGASRRSAAVLAGQEVLLAQSSQVRGSLLQLSEGLRESLQNPASQGLAKALTADDRELCRGLDKPLGAPAPGSELPGQWRAIAPAYQEAVRPGYERVVQAVGSDPKAAQQQFVTAFLPPRARLEAMLSAFQEQLK